MRTRRLVLLALAASIAMALPAGASPLQDVVCDVQEALGVDNVRDCRNT